MQIPLLHRQGYFYKGRYMIYFSTNPTGQWSLPVMSV